MATVKEEGRRPRPSWRRRANAAAVCKKFETSRRRELLTFSHHETVAHLPPHEADAWLSWCEKPIAATGRPRSRHELRKALDERKRQKDHDEKIAAAQELAARLYKDGHAKEMTITSPAHLFVGPAIESGPKKAFIDTRPSNSHPPRWPTKPERSGLEIDPRAAPAEDELPKPPQVSLMITRAQRQALRDLGYSAEQIREMTPAKAHDILGLNGEDAAPTGEATLSEVDPPAASAEAATPAKPSVDTKAEFAKFRQLLATEPFQELPKAKSAEEMLWCMEVLGLSIDDLQSVPRSTNPTYSRRRRIAAYKPLTRSPRRPKRGSTAAR
jgi:hypothetical protein